MTITRKIAAGACALGLLAGAAGLAGADEVANNLDTTIDNPFEIMSLQVGGGAGTTTIFVNPVDPINRNDSEPSGCNIQAGQNLVLSVSSSDTAVATVPSALLTIDGCGIANGRTLSVTPVGQGEAQIEFQRHASTTASGGFEMMDGRFKAVVAAATATDTTDPTITLTSPADGAAFTLNEVVTASYSCEDEAGGSGLKSCIGTVADGSAIDTSSVGAKSFTVDAEDNAGNTASTTHSYNVRFSFSGFGAPVDTVLNKAKAGQAVPLKWTLKDANGVPFTTLDPATVRVTVESLACSGTATADLVEEYAANSSGLLNLGNGNYQFNWKSPTSYAGSCKTLRLNLAEGSTTAPFYRTATFHFTK